MFGNRGSKIPAGANVINDYRAESVATAVEGDIEMGLGLIGAIIEYAHLRHTGNRLDLAAVGIGALSLAAIGAGTNNRFRISRRFNRLADEGEAALRAKGLDPQAVAMPETNS